MERLNKEFYKTSDGKIITSINRPKYFFVLDVSKNWHFAIRPLDAPNFRLEDIPKHIESGVFKKIIEWEWISKAKHVIRPDKSEEHIFVCVGKGSFGLFSLKDFLDSQFEPFIEFEDGVQHVKVFKRVVELAYEAYRDDQFVTVYKDIESKSFINVTHFPDRPVVTQGQELFI
jgi:hypothetical protein